MPEKTLIISASEVSGCLDLDEVFQVVEEAFLQTGLGRVVLPPKLFMNLPARGHANFMFAGPASVPSMKAMGVKIVTGFPDNPARFGLPYILATLILTDPESGYPLAVLDGVQVTNARTGAMVAVAAKYLARRSSRSLAVIGGGTQGRSVSRALCRLFPFTEIRVFDINPRAAKDYQGEMSPFLGIPIPIFSTCQQAVEGADIIVTVTSAEGEFVKSDWVKPGSFIASVGSHQELESSLPLRVEKLVVDDRQQARYRGELARGYERGQIHDDIVYAELGEIVSGKKPGRETDEERNLACLTGVGTLDVAVARRAYETALDRKLGKYADLL